MNNIITFILSLPKTIVFNLKFLPFKQAIHLPVFITYRTKFSGKGKLLIDSALTGVIRIGYHHVPICNYRDETRIILCGSWICKGNVRLGNGTKIRVSSDAILSTGCNLHISGSSSINCYSSISFGDNVLVGWNCLFMDSDAHPVFVEDGVISNYDSSIYISDHVWVGANCSILKGTIIPANCVVGLGSIVSGRKFDESSVIVGHPAKSIKKISGWSEIYPCFHRKTNYNN